MDPIELQRARIASKHFWDAAELCRPRVEDPGCFIVIEPWIVLLAFSTEIGLKALVMMLRRKRMHGHPLLPLFVELPVEAQAFIAGHTGLPRTEFDASLAQMNNAFVEWRYLHEVQGYNIDLRFPPKLGAAVQAALQQRWTIPTG